MLHIISGDRQACLADPVSPMRFRKNDPVLSLRMLGNTASSLFA